MTNVKYCDAAASSSPPSAAEYAHIHTHHLKNIKLPSIVHGVHEMKRT